MVIFDTPRKKDGYSHMVATSIKELHEFAERIGVKRCWYCNKRGKNRPHYDIRYYTISRALRNGAKQVTRKELRNFLEEHYGKID
jgi:hypothetical protein